MTNGAPLTQAKAIADKQHNLLLPYNKHSQQQSINTLQPPYGVLRVKANCFLNEAVVGYGRVELIIHIVVYRPIKLA